MDNENSINILLSLFFPKGRESEELFNIRPPFGCTLSIAKYLWLQIRCKRGLERKVRELPASSELRRFSESRGLPRTSHSSPLPPPPHLHHPALLSPPNAEPFLSSVGLGRGREKRVAGGGNVGWSLKAFLSLPQPPPLSPPLLPPSLLPAEYLGFPIPF